MIPKVSVVIATYNYARFLPGAIESALGQTFSDMEIVIVDDGSMDETPTIVKPYLTNPRIRYVRTDHRGQPHAKNEGIRQSRGQLVAFLDADDLWLPTKLERQVALFEQKPELGVVCCFRKCIDEEGFELQTTQRPHFRGNVLPEMFWRNFVCFSSSVVRRDVFDDVGLFDEQLQLAIDYDLWLRIAPRYPFDYVDEPLVKYRTGHANLSARAHERVLTVRRIIQRFLQEAGGKDVISRSLIRLTLAEHWCDTAVLSRRRLVAMYAFMRALVYRPFHLPAWRGLLTVWCPETFKRFARRLLGRPDWRLRQRVQLQD